MGAAEHYSSKGAHIMYETTQLENFMRCYTGHLTTVRAEFPLEYAWPESALPTVLERMRAALVRGSYNKDGYAIHRTCKELGIKYTYKAINAYLHGTKEI
jgi:hypothetical protein